MVEELLAFEPATRQFAYRILQGPGVDKRADFTATLSITETDQGRTVRWQADFDAGNAPEEKVEKARQSATRMYQFCLAHLGPLLDQEG